MFALIENLFNEASDTVIVIIIYYHLLLGSLWKSIVAGTDFITRGLVSQLLNDSDGVAIAGFVGFVVVKLLATE